MEKDGLDNKNKIEEIKNYCVAYTILALSAIYHSANKERSIEDFIEEIKVMFNVYPTNEERLKQLTEYTLKKEGKNKVIVCNGIEKIGMTIEECAEYLGVSKQLVSELVKLPDFPCVKFKRRILINKNKISDWFVDNTGRFIKY